MNSMSIFVILMLFTIGHIQLTSAKECGSNEERVQCETPISCQPSCDNLNGTVCPTFACMEGCHCQDGFIRTSDTDKTCIKKDQCDATTRDESTCGSNEVKTGCAPLQRCQPSCENPQGTRCPRMCGKNQCVCREGFVRDNNNNSQCIELSQCPTNNQRFVVITKPEKCGENEEAIECAPIQTCQPSCAQPNGTICPAICSKNPCVCKDGYIRDENNNYTCIEKSRCDKNTARNVIVIDYECGENTEENLCVNRCQPSCQEPNRRPCLAVRCSDGCVCRTGYLRETNDLNSRCVQECTK